MAREICADCGREPVDCTCRQGGRGGRRADPKPGEMWRSRDRREPGRTVLVMAVTNLGTPGWDVKIRTLTRGDGTPMTRKSETRVRLARFHRDYTFERQEP